MPGQTTLPLHAEFLLLAHEPASGKKLVDTQHLKAGLAGAALLELNLQEALAIDGEGKHARLRATGADVDPELIEVVARADGQSPRKAVARIGGVETFKDRAGDLRDATWNRLESARLVRSEEEKVLGMFATTRHVQTSTARSSSLETLRGALLGTEPPGIRTAGLVAVVSATGLLPKLLPEIDRKQLAARVTVITESGWGGDAVSKAITDLQAALVAAVVVPVVVSSGG